MMRLPKWLLMVLALALLVGLTAPVLAADTAKGKIKSITADKKEFVFTDKDGKDWNCVMATDAKVHLNNKVSTLSDLKAGDECTITYTKQGDELKVSDIECNRK